MHGTIHEGITVNKYNVYNKRSFLPHNFSKAAFGFISLCVRPTKTLLAKKKKGLSHWSVAIACVGGAWNQWAQERTVLSCTHYFQAPATQAAVQWHFVLSLRQVKSSDYHCLQDIQRRNYRYLTHCKPVTSLIKKLDEIGLINRSMKIPRC